MVHLFYQNKFQFMEGNYTTFQKCVSSAKCYILSIVKSMGLGVRGLWI